MLASYCYNLVITHSIRSYVHQREKAHHRQAKPSRSQSDKKDHKPHQRNSDIASNDLQARSTALKSCSPVRRPSASARSIPRPGSHGSRPSPTRARHTGPIHRPVRCSEGASLGSPELRQALYCNLHAAWQFASCSPQPADWGSVLDMQRLWSDLQSPAALALTVGAVAVVVAETRVRLPSVETQTWPPGRHAGGEIMAEVSLLLGDCAKVWPARASAVIKTVCMAVDGRRVVRPKVYRALRLCERVARIDTLWRQETSLAIVPRIHKVCYVNRSCSATVTTTE
ncbi:hypothetical protein KC326_g37 [Hortaea werneckii]|nr:hypothetical protein KC326_g37 [Hortaea werneckii]